MADNDRWRNDQGRDRHGSRGDQNRAEGRYEDFGGRPDEGRFTGEGGGSRDRGGRYDMGRQGSEASRYGGQGRSAEQGRYEDFGGRPDRGRFTGEGGGSGGYGGARGGSGREDRGGYGGGGRGGYGSGDDRGFGGDYYSGFYGADQDYGRGRREDQDRGYGGSGGYGGSSGSGGGGRSYLESHPEEERRFYRQGGSGREDYDRGAYGGSGRGDYRDERGFFERVTDEVSSWFGSDDASRRREQDAYRGNPGAQHHRGRGPKGYSRSDDRIREDVNDRLTDDPYVDASEIEVSVANREVTLSGTVDSREAKRRAEDVAERVGGVAHVQNNLRVQRQGSSGYSGGTTGSGMASTGGSGGNVTGSPSATGLTGTGSGSVGGSQGAASQGVTTPPMGESVTGMNSSDANRIAQETFGSTDDVRGTESRRS